VSATREREIPLERIACIASLARVTRTEKVVVVCRSRTVAKQYRRGVKSAGGKVGNLHFLYLTDHGRGA
jgi:hypothetical protein